MVADEGPIEGPNYRVVEAAGERKLGSEEELRTARKESNGTWDRGTYASLNGTLRRCNL